MADRECFSPALSCPGGTRGETRKPPGSQLYGAEIRGGTANSTVIISDEEIGSPIITNPSVLIALNEQSFTSSSKTKDGATIIINSSLVKEKVHDSYEKIVLIPATEIADKRT